MATQFGQFTTSPDGQYIEVDVHEPGSQQVIHLTLTRQEFDAAGERKVPAPRALDKVSIDRIGKLHPKVRAEALRLFVQANAALTGRAQVRVVQGLRTFQEQAALYAQGRTAPGKIVTNAKPEESYHVWAFAMDFALLVDGKEISWDTLKDYDGDGTSDWMEVVKIYKDAGWTWGGNFKSIKDMPHLEKTLGHDWRYFYALYKAGKVDRDGYITL